MTDPFDLQRFVQAQAATYPTALAELRSGRKRSHWMWFVFPQVRGLGVSPQSQRFGITGLEEAQAYVAHDVLGPRLRECATALLSSSSAEAVEVLGETDAMKLRSSMTLFALAAPDEPVFGAVLERCFGGEPDPETLRILRPR